MNKNITILETIVIIPIETISQANPINMVSSIAIELHLVTIK